MEIIIESIRIINEELGSIQIDVAILKAQMSEVLWLVRGVWGLIGLAVGGAILRLVIKNRNNKK